MEGPSSNAEGDAYLGNYETSHSSHSTLPKSVDVAPIHIRTWELSDIVLANSDNVAVAMGSNAGGRLEIASAYSAYFPRDEVKEPASDPPYVRGDAYKSMPVYSSQGSGRTAHQLPTV